LRLPAYNPTGNILTDTDISHLARIDSERDIPFIIDNAYGAPFQLASNFRVVEGRVDLQIN